MHDAADERNLLHISAGEPTAKAMQAFVMDGFPAGAVAPLTADSMSAFMGADGGRSPRVTSFSQVIVATVHQLDDPQHRAWGRETLALAHSALQYTPRRWAWSTWLSCHST